MKVSKELFESVQGSKFGGNVKVVIEDDMVKYYVIDASVSISLNDFFFMCKKWAEFNCYIVKSYSYNGGLGFAEVQWMSPENKVVKFEYAENEQQAVFDVCHWILNKEIR